MKEKTAKEILEKVHTTYQNIAEEFSQTRKTAWPEFEKFSKHIKSHFKILDLGCGNGRLYKYLSPTNYTGVDVSKNLINEAKKNHPNANFKTGSILEVPSKNEEFDMVFCIASLHHIPSKNLRKKAIKEIKRILNKDGILVLTNWNLFQKKYIKYICKSIMVWALTLGKYDWNDTFIPWGKEKLPRYYHAFTENELKKLLKKDFEIIEADTGKNLLTICRKK